MSDQFPFHELAGAIHLHTSFSDGGISFPELIVTAQEVGLDYIVVTDHMNLGGKKAGYEGFFGGLFVAVGYEHQDFRNRNHYLSIGVEKVAEDRKDPQTYIRQIARQGGAGFIAHPMEQRHYFKKLPPYPWTAWDARDFDGIELWNQMSDWMENFKNWRSVVRIFFPRRFMNDAPAGLIKRWDEMNRARFVAAIGGVDAHTRRVDLGLIHFTIFPVKVELKGIRTHLYLPAPLPRNDPVRASRILVHALRSGHGFISNLRRGDARGTRLYLRDANGAIIGPGIPPSPPALPATLVAELPARARIRLVRNGAPVNTVDGRSAEFPISQNGIYRIEAVADHAWIYANPFPVGAYPI
jgi:hypothetical protein